VKAGKELIAVVYHGRHYEPINCADVKKKIVAFVAVAY